MLLMSKLATRDTWLIGGSDWTLDYSDGTMLHPHFCDAASGSDPKGLGADHGALAPSGRWPTSGPGHG